VPEFDAIQGPKPYRKAYPENVKKFLEKVDVEWNTPILEWGTNPCLQQRAWPKGVPRSGSCGRRLVLGRRTDLLTPENLCVQPATVGTLQVVIVDDDNGSSRRPPTSWAITCRKL
jgi:hypothetical protein